MREVEGILLAAGSSRRAGAFKPAMKLRGKPLLHYAVEQMIGLCSRIVVVGALPLDRIISLLEPYPSCTAVANPRAETGMFSSVKVGVAAARAERVFLLPSDLPLVPQSVYIQLLREHFPVVVPAFHGRQGHPILLDASTFQAILNEPETSSLRDVTRRVGIRTLAVEAEEILLDVDTPQDLEDLAHRIG
jgi:molybdenum cofactor cytidylyltransferase